MQIYFDIRAWLTGTSYFSREFADDKGKRDSFTFFNFILLSSILTLLLPLFLFPVLLEHQKAKHYRCPYCPRRLNTAGGLTVHLHQVHKAEPTR